MKDVNINKVLEKLGIDSLNAMQQESQECMLRGRNDVVVLSPTGSGKTLAYLLPLVQMLEAIYQDFSTIVIDNIDVIRTILREEEIQDSIVKQRLLTSASGS